MVDFLIPDFWTTVVVARVMTCQLHALSYKQYSRFVSGEMRTTNASVFICEEFAVLVK